MRSRPPTTRARPTPFRGAGRLSNWSIGAIASVASAATIGSLLCIGCATTPSETPNARFARVVVEVAAEDPATVLAVAVVPIAGTGAAAGNSATALRGARNGHVRMHPASTLKLLTAAVAIDAGLLDRSVVTRLLREKDGTILLLEGGGDPLLTRADLEVLWRRAAEQEVALDDVLLVDSNLFEGAPFGSGWMWDDEPAPYMPWVSALLVDGGAVTVRVQRANAIDSDPVIAFDPPVPRHFRIDADITPIARSVPPAPDSGTDAILPLDAEARITIDREVLGDRRTIRIRGSLAPGGSAEASFSVPDPDLFAGELLATLADPSRPPALAARVVRLERELTPADRERFVEVARFERPLREVLARMLKDSDNLAAENVLRLVGVATDPSRPGSAISGLVAVHRYVAALGFDPQEFRVVDGSGLSFYDSVSAELLVAVLRDMAARESFAEFRAMLPLAGRDGTLVHRFVDGGVAAGFDRIQAKTGTIGGVSGLAGYADGQSGATYAFAILAGEYVGPAGPWRDRLDALAAIIVEN